MSDRLRPLFRWIGGKARLVHTIAPIIRCQLEHGGCYFEPFLGAGSVFCAVSPGKAVLGDANRHLMETYQCIRQAPREVEREVRLLESWNTPARYYGARTEFNNSGVGARRAALFIFLNRTCFNGIWRVNTKGEFNVPFGARSNPLFPSREHIERVAEALETAELMCADFASTLDGVASGDTVYLDPPYPPLNGTAFFTHYTKERFGASEQVRLAKTVHSLNAKGVRLVLSNTDVPLVRDLYRGFTITEFNSRRFVASHGKRLRVRDLLITNVDLDGS